MPAFAAAASALLLAGGAPAPSDGLVPTFDYVPARDGLALLKGGPSDAGYAADARAHPDRVWQPRYLPQGADPKGGSDVYSGQYQWNADPEYAWSNGFSPFSIDADGDLRITAQAAASAAPPFAPGEVPADPAGGAPYPYVSGVLSSKNRFSQQGGYVEIEARAPTGPALWPALWLMPVRERHPPELDVMEAVGGYDPVTTYRATALAVGGAEQVKVRVGRDLAADFHRYGLAWDDARIAWYLDGAEVGSRSIARDPEFGQRFYILMGAQVGSTLAEWVPAPSQATPARSDLVIRSVRAWQRPGPVGLTLSASAYLDDRGAGDAVATLSAEGFGGDSAFAFAKVEDPDGMFAISGDRLVLARRAPAGSNPVHPVAIEVADGAGRTLRRLFRMRAVAADPVQANYVADQRLDGPAWTAEGATVGPGGALAETASFSRHQIASASVLPRQAGARTYEAWIDAAPLSGERQVHVQVFDGSWGSQAFAVFDLSAGEASYSAVTGAFTRVEPFAAPLGDGRLRCGLRFTTDAASTGFRLVIGTARSDGGASFEGQAGAGAGLRGPWLYAPEADDGGR